MGRNSRGATALTSPLARGRDQAEAVWIQPVGGFSLIWFLSWACLLFGTWSVLTVRQAWSQQQATLSGVVRDPSGAIVPGATVRVTNLNTHVTVTAVTNSTGYYVVGNLIPGTYMIAAQDEGFKTATRSELTLQVAQAATVDFQLELGQ